MARLDDKWKQSITLADLHDFPVWTWDDEEDGYVPVDDVGLDLEQYYTLFVRVTFRTGDRHFDGYVVYSGTVYAFSLFVGNRKFVFNVNLPELIKSDLPHFYRAAGGQEFSLFPLHYESGVFFKGGESIQGEILVPKK